MISVVFQVEEEASDKDNKNCSNNGERQDLFIYLFIFCVTVIY